MGISEWDSGPGILLLENRSNGAHHLRAGALLKSGSVSKAFTKPA